MFSRLNWLVLPPWLTLSVVALILANYLGAGEYRSAMLQGLMTRPYRRVVLLYLVIIGSGFLLLLTGSPTASLGLMVLMKIGFDVAVHRKEHAAA